jgi:hypothetical protein
MNNIYELEHTAAKLWNAIHNISSGVYDERSPTERELKALAEILEGAEEIMTQKNYIKMLLS